MEGLGSQDVPRLAQQMRETSTSLTVLQLPEPTGSTPGLAAILPLLNASAGTLHRLEDGTQLLPHFPFKEVAPTPIYRGPLEIGRAWVGKGGAVPACSARRDFWRGGSHAHSCGALCCGPSCCCLPAGVYLAACLLCSPPEQCGTVSERAVA